MILLILYSVKRRKIPVVNFFIGLCVSALLFNTSYFFELTRTNFDDAKLWFYIKYNFLPFINYFWIMISLDFVHVIKKRLQLSAILIAIPHALFLIAINTNEIHHLIFKTIYYSFNGTYHVLQTSMGTLLHVIYLLLGIILMSCQFLYLQGYFKSTAFHRHGYRIMLIATFIPIVPTYMNIAHKAYMNLDYTACAVILTIVCYAFGIFQYRILRTKPIATEAVLRLSNEGIMLIDNSDFIIDVNDSFLHIYPEYSVLSGKETFEDFKKNHPEFHGGFDDDGTIQFSLYHQQDEYFYSAKLYDILQKDQSAVGKMLKINDITLFVEKQQRLKELADGAALKAETNEVSFLRAQIKPHFLYNTLTAIMSMIKTDPDDARTLVMNLSQYLRYSCAFDNNTTIITLRQELELVETYVNIQKARFGDRIAFELICEAKPEIFVPMFIIQPLVENAINHGILKRMDGGLVRLKISEEADKTIFEIKDTGVGMSQELIEALLNGTVFRQGIGILNIHKRLIKYYGQGLSISSKESVGTTISFFITKENASKCIEA